MKHSGALMSSRLMPPKVGSSAAMMSTSLSGSRLVDLDVEHVDAGELLEQAALAFHHRLAGERADVAEAEHGGAVGDDGDEVAARGERARFARIGDDRLAGERDAGRIGQRQVALVGQSLGRRDRDLAGRRQAVIVERGFAQLFFHGGPFLLANPHSLWGDGREARPLELVLSSPDYLPVDGEHHFFFFTGGKSVQTPSNTSAAMPIDSPSVGCGWMVWPMSVASAPISIASADLADQVAGMRADDAAADDAMGLFVEQQLGEAFVAAVGDGAADAAQGNMPLPILMPLAFASVSVSPTQATSGSV